MEVNAEELRKKFVDFDGQKELWIQRDEFAWQRPENDWEGCFAEWAE